MDTNVYSAFKAGDSEVIRALRRPEKLLVCAAVLGELLSGFKCGAKEQDNRDDLELFLDTPRVTVAVVDYETAEFYSEIFKVLRGKGRPIPTNDMWIAASALQHGAAVYTLDSHFAHIDGLVVWTPDVKHDA